MDGTSIYVFHLSFYPDAADFLAISEEITVAFLRVVLKNTGWHQPAEGEDKQEHHKEAKDTKEDKHHHHKDHHKDKKKKKFHCSDIFFDDQSDQQNPIVFQVNAGTHQFRL